MANEMNLAGVLAAVDQQPEQVAMPAPSAQLPTLKGILANVEQAEAATAQQELVRSISTLRLPTAGEIGDKAVDAFKMALIGSLNFELKF